MPPTSIRIGWSAFSMAFGSTSTQAGGPGSDAGTAAITTEAVTRIGSTRMERSLEVSAQTCLDIGAGADPPVQLRKTLSGGTNANFSRERRVWCGEGREGSNPPRVSRRVLEMRRLMVLVGGLGGLLQLVVDLIEELLGLLRVP